MLEGHTRRTPHSNQRSYIYFIQGADKVKIGLAHDPERRLAELQCGSPVLLTIVGLIYTANPTKVESDLHRRFAKYRKYLEWFEYSHEIRLYIERYAPITPIKHPLKTKNPYENELLKALAHGEWVGKGIICTEIGRATGWPKHIEKAMNALTEIGVVETRITKLPQNGQRVTQYRIKGNRA